MEENRIPPKNKRFREFRKLKHLTQRAMAGVLGISQSAVAGIEAGMADIGEAYLRILENVYHLNPLWVKEGEEPMILPARSPGIPILADIPAGNWMEWIDTYPPGAGDDYIAAPADVKGENLFAIRVHGPSMEPMFMNGDILVINPHKVWTRGPAVVRHQGGYQIRLVRKLSNKYILTPVNPAYEEEEIEPDETTQLYVPVKRISMQDI